MNSYIVSQILALISTLILLTYSVMKVKRRTILLCNIAINSLLAIHYFLLDNYTGAVCSGVTVFMVCMFYYKSSLGKFGFFVPLLFTGIFIAAGIMTWNNLWSIIPVAGNMLLVIALWNDDENLIKAIFIAVGILWIVLNVHLKSVANVVGQVFAVLCNVVYFLRVRKPKHCDTATEK